ncbi:MAG: ROK family protein [bacterium]|nr:ROK family protein [bacterium]
MSSGLVIGIDIGGTNTPFALVDAQGRTPAQGLIPTEGGRPLSDLLDRLVNQIEQVLARAGEKEPPLAVGVGAPNANALTGWVESPPNVSWGRADLAGELALRLRLPVFVTNDANAAALGEWWWGAGAGVQDLLVITIGTGLGSGLIVGGELLHGASGHAGELGHLCVEPEGRCCSCGLRGCLETWVSAGGMLRTAAESGLDLRPWCRPGESPAPLHLHRAAEEGNLRAARVFRHTAEMLARGLAAAVHLTSPGRIVLGGGIMRAGDWLLEPVRALLPDLLMEPFRPTVTVERSRLDPDLAGVLGAAVWARHGLARREANRA